MKSLKIAIILVAGALAPAIGCGDDSNNSPDAPIITGTGGTTRMDAGLGGAGGGGSGGTADAPIATGGTGGTIDAATHDDSRVMDAPMPDSVTMDVGGEAGVTTNICAGMTAAACDLLIRNAATGATVTALDVPNTNPPAYSVCSQ